jgi:hypothetical protein
MKSLDGPFSISVRSDPAAAASVLRANVSAEQQVDQGNEPALTRRLGSASTLRTFPAHEDIHARPVGQGTARPDWSSRSGRDDDEADLERILDALEGRLRIDTIRTYGLAGE